MYNIAIVGSPKFEQFAAEITSMQQFPNVNLMFINDRLQRAIPEILSQLELFHPHAVLMGQNDAERFGSRVHAPVFTVKLEILDFLALHRFISDYEHTAVVLAQETDMDFGFLEALLQVRYNRFVYYNAANIPALLARLKEENYRYIISNYSCTTCAETLGLDTLYYYSRASIENTLKTAVQYLDKVSHDTRIEQQIFSFLDNASEGMLVLNNDFVVEYANPSAVRLLGKPYKEILLRSASPWLPADLAEKLRTAQKLRNVRFTLNGVPMVGNISRPEADSVRLSTCLYFDRAVSAAERRNGFPGNTEFRPARFSELVKRSPSLESVTITAASYASVSAPVLIHAAPGTESLEFAFGIHQMSRRAERPFLPVPVRAFSEADLGKRLFGGIGQDPSILPALMEANHGTVYLEGIEALPQELQYRLLQFLHTNVNLSPDGSSYTADIRFVFSTQEDLLALVSRGSFSRELYYEISTLPLTIPALVQRRKDIAGILLYFLRDYPHTDLIALRPLIEREMAELRDYDFPGNLKELKNLAEQIALFCGSPDAETPVLLHEIFLSLRTRQIPTDTAPHISLRISGDYPNDISEAEQMLFRYYYDTHRGSIADLAAKLDMSRTTLYNKMRRFGLV